MLEVDFDQFDQDDATEFGLDGQILRQIRRRIGTLPRLREAGDRRRQHGSGSDDRVLGLASSSPGQLQFLVHRYLRSVPPALQSDTSMVRRVDSRRMIPNRTGRPRGCGDSLGRPAAPPPNSCRVSARRVGAMRGSSGQSDSTREPPDRTHRRSIHESLRSLQSYGAGNITLWL